MFGKRKGIVICVGGNGHRLPFCFASTTNLIPNLALNSVDGFQCFPLYTYALDGKLRRDNITDWALGQFQAKYGPDVTKRDIFHYVYGLLHSPEYRERYKENLKRELPRIPLVGMAEPMPQEPTRPKVATLRQLRKVRRRGTRARLRPGRVETSSGPEGFPPGRPGTSSAGIYCQGAIPLPRLTSRSGAAAGRPARRLRARRRSTR